MLTDEAGAFNAMLEHHRQLCDEMDERVADIVRRIEEGDDSRRAVAALIAFLGSDVLPHALAEEKTIYRVAMARPGLADTVRSMIEEHEVLLSTGAKLAKASTSTTVTEHAIRLAELFRSHVQRENEGLLPILLEDSDVDLADQMREMQRLLTSVDSEDNVSVSDPEAVLLSLLFDASKVLRHAGQEEKACQVVASAWAALRVPRPELAARATAQLHVLAKRSRNEPVPLRSKSEITTGYRELDVRQLAPAQRHTIIFAEYGALIPGTGYVLVNDHDPKPLYYQFEAEHHGAFTWDAVEEGPDVWRVVITKPLPRGVIDDLSNAPVREVIELDVRVITHAKRHDVIFAAYNRLVVGESFVLVNDHDPMPLRYQFEAQYAEEFTWAYLESGPLTWRVRIGRAAPSN